MKLFRNVSCLSKTAGQTLQIKPQVVSLIQIQIIIHTVKVMAVCDGQLTCSGPVQDAPPTTHEDKVV